MAAIMNCPHCKIQMTRTEVQRRNCLRLDYQCPGCGYTDFDFHAITSMTSDDAPKISNTNFTPAGQKTGNPPPSEKERERWRKYWQRRKLIRQQRCN